MEPTADKLSVSIKNDLRRLISIVMPQALEGDASWSLPVSVQS